MFIASAIMNGPRLGLSDLAAIDIVHGQSYKALGR
jgi:hypothetical protein